MSCDCWDSSKKDRCGTWGSCSFWGFQPSQISMFLWACLAHQKIHANRLWHLSSPLVPSGWPIHSCESGSYIQSVEDQVPFAAGRVPAYAGKLQVWESGSPPKTQSKSMYIWAFGLILYIHTSRMNMTKRYVLPCTISLYLYKRIIRVSPSRFNLHVPYFEGKCSQVIAASFWYWATRLWCFKPNHQDYHYIFSRPSRIDLLGGKYTQLIGSLEISTSKRHLFPLLPKLITYRMHTSFAGFFFS